jgi:hypothetical protein
VATHGILDAVWDATASWVPHVAWGSWGVAWGRRRQVWGECNGRAWTGKARGGALALLASSSVGWSVIAAAAALLTVSG